MNRIDLTSSDNYKDLHDVLFDTISNNLFHHGNIELWSIPNKQICGYIGQFMFDIMDIDEHYMGIYGD